MDIPKYKLKPEMLRLLPNIEFSNNDTKRLCGNEVSKFFFTFLKIRIFEKIALFKKYSRTYFSKRDFFSFQFSKIVDR